MTRYDRKDSITALHRDNIINAADELFTKNGFDKTTMDDIATHAQYSKRTIYSYFESKDEIYSYFVAKGSRFFADQLNEAVTSSVDFIECYHELCRVVVYFYDDQFPYYEGVINVINNTNSKSTTGATAQIRTIADEINATLEEFFARGQEQGIVLQNVDIKRIVLIIWSNINSFTEMTHNKSEYINSTLHLTSDEFSMFGFNLILNSILSI